MEQLMVRNVTGPSEPQSDAELQIGGQLSVPFSHKGGAEQPEDRWGWEVAPDREQASPEAPALKLPGDNWGEVGVPFFPHLEGIEEATLLFECCVVVL